MKHPIVEAMMHHPVDAKADDDDSEKSQEAKKLSEMIRNKKKFSMVRGPFLFLQVHNFLPPKFGTTK